jgi:excinuclease ABC subunit C
MTSKDLQKFKLPDAPGVYFFLKGKDILYIGKATSLKDRVKSYFGKDLIETRGSFILDMVFKADKIKYKIADSVLEGLILESNLIKKYQPKYNTREKDDRSFNYIVITKEKLPRVLTVRGKNLKATREVVFGPYPNGGQLREALKIIRRIFPFLDDKSKNYIEFYRQINLAPDLNNRKMYLQNIHNIKLFFEGKKKKVLKNLENEMRDYAKKHEFEKAGEIKRQIFAIKHINDVALMKQSFTSSGRFRIEAYDIAHMGGKNMVGVMTVVENGEMAKHEYKKFKIRTQNDANDTGALKEVLERRLAHTEWAYPQLIVVDGGVAQLNTAKKILIKLGLNIRLVSVLKDERHKPKNILGDKEAHLKYEKEILLANVEAHRFAIAYHKKMRNRNFLHEK